jgi:16S rRNA C1402 N4-methylase RsmH
MPAQAELDSNPRASSARLRIAERLDVPWRQNQMGEEA